MPGGIPTARRAFYVGSVGWLQYMEGRLFCQVEFADFFRFSCRYPSTWTQFTMINLRLSTKEVPLIFRK